MTGDIYLGRLLGVPLRLHWSWFLAVFLIAWTLAVGFFPQTLPEYGGDGAVYWGLGLLAALGLFVSVLLHELGHAFVARRFGVSVRGIRLFVFGGVAELGSEPKKPGHEILIALGGPAVTVVLIGLCNVGLRLVMAGSAVDWAATDGTLRLQGGSLMAAGSTGLLYYLGMINTAVLIFNLIPAFPLDGGRVLRGIVWSVTGDYLKSTRLAAGVGIAFAWLLFAGGFLTAFRGNLLGGLWLFFLGTFLRNAAQSSVAYAQLQQMLRGVGVEVGRAGDPVTGRGPAPEVHPQEPVLQALQKFAESGQSRLLIVENGRLVGLLCVRGILDLIEIPAGPALPPAGLAVSGKASHEFAAGAQALGGRTRTTEIGWGRGRTPTAREAVVDSGGQPW